MVYGYRSYTKCSGGRSLTVVLSEPPGSCKSRGCKGGYGVNPVRIIIFVLHEGFSPVRPARTHTYVSTIPADPERLADVTVQDVGGLYVCHTVSLYGSPDQ